MTSLFSKKFLRLTFFWGLILLGVFVTLALTYLIINSRNLTEEDRVLKEWAEKLPEISDEDWFKIKKQALEKVLVYEGLIENHFIQDGMLVNRRNNGQTLDECDSLLFTSLHFVALKKLGLEFKAQLFWQAIIKNHRSGAWYRHPLCQSEAISRDMMVGLLAALLYGPALESSELLSQLISYIADNGGYFANGPFFISLMTPQLALELRSIAILKEIKDLNQLFPSWITQGGVSTLEWESLHLSRGYTAHLQALHTWLHLEIEEQAKNKNLVINSDRPIFFQLASYLSLFSHEDFFHQRLRWITYKLSLADSENLFFRWLRLKTNSLLSSKVKAQLLKELLALKQFPDERSPKDCDRKADYLWQRNSLEYEPHSQDCSHVFNGSDFSWMVALILSG